MGAITLHLSENWIQMKLFSNKMVYHLLLVSFFEMFYIISFQVGG